MMLDVSNPQTLRSAIDRTIKEALIEPSLGSYYDILSNFVLAGGKRLRPLLCIYCYKATGGADPEIFKVAAAVEMIHAHSLILDDIMDEDEMRRGRKTVHMQLMDLRSASDSNDLKRADATKKTLFFSDDIRYGVSNAIMLANIAAIISRQLMLSSAFPEGQRIKAMKMMEESDRGVYHGQMMDMQMERKRSSEKEYLEMASLKTGKLFRMAAGLGCIMSGANKDITEGLMKFASDAAIAFQIKDDMLDISEGKGHKVGSDIDMDKNSIVLIKLKEEIDISGKTTQEVVSLIRKQGVLDYCENLSRLFWESSVKALGSCGLDQSDEDLLLSFSKGMVSRTS
jgi:geranylgeranyl diphosphate synthase, type I